jgi:hypothetical protein
MNLNGLDPETPAEWQEAANSANFMLLLDSAIQYGLITGPRADVERCEWILAEAKKRGITPQGEFASLEEPRKADPDRAKT